MLQIKKISVGVLPINKMFRIQAGWGEVVDAILASRNKPPLTADFFKGVQTSAGRDQFILRNDDTGTAFSLGIESIVFTKQSYDTDIGVNVDKFMEEFLFLWAIVQKKVQVTDIRRIGIVAEHRIYNESNPSKKLISKLLRIGAPDNPAKFNLSFEKRLSADGGIIDLANGKFINIIQSIYDSSLDADHPEENAINCNLDVQKYFSPLLSRNETDEFKIMRRKFEEQWRGFQDELKSLGFYL